MNLRLPFAPRLLAALLLLAVAPLYGASSIAPTTPATKPSTMPSPAKWEKTIKAFETADLKAPPPAGAVLFVGSSTIRRWVTLEKDFPEQTVINRGFGGSWMYDAAYYVDRIVTPYKPRLIVLYSGANDIAAGRSPEQVFGDFKLFVEKVRAKMPDVRIVCMGAGPSPKRWASSDKIKRANQLIREYMAAGTNLDYVEVWDEMLGADGKPRDELYGPDHHHNNAEGYKVRVEVLRSHLN